jgi:hypothetical protein
MKHLSQNVMRHARQPKSLGSALLLKEVRARELWPALLMRLDWDEAQHPRVEAGSPEGGQFTSGEGGTLLLTGPMLDPAVIEVGGDEWNRATARRLEHEYQTAKPKIEALIKELEGKGEAVTIQDYPRSWDEMDPVDREEAETLWKEANFSSYLDSERDNWYENDAPVEAGQELAEDAEWREEQVQEWLDNYEPVPEGIAAADIASAITITTNEDYGGSKAGDIAEITWDEARLVAINPWSDPNQLPLEGMTPERAALTLDQRAEVEEVIRDNWDDARVRAQEHLDPPDYLDESVQEQLNESWGSMSDEEQYAYAYERFKDDWEASEHTRTVTFQEPSKLEVFDSARKGYKETAAFAKVLATERAAQLFEERGIKFGSYFAADPSVDRAEKLHEKNLIAVRAIDTRVWENWKGSSSSYQSQAFQLAAARELGGHERFSDTNEVLLEQTADTGFPGGMRGLQAYVRGQWETTQYLLEKSNHATTAAYRAVLLAKADLDSLPREYVEATPEHWGTGKYTKLPTLTLERNGLASFTAKASVANGWNGVGTLPMNATRVVVRAEVPRTAVISVPVYGQNLHNEEELVVVGTAWKTWDAWLDRAPTRTAVPLKALKSWLTRRGTDLYLDLSTMEIEEHLPHWMTAIRTIKALKYSEDQPREPAGSPEGGRFASASSGLPASVTLSSNTAVGEVLAGAGNWKLTVAKVDTSYRTDRPRYELTIEPRDAQPGYETITDRYGRTVWYDPTVSHLEMDEYTKQPEPRMNAGESDRRILTLPNDPDVLYRGMSAGEYRAAQASGSLGSRGDYNFVNQTGATFFTTDPQQAASYAGGYAPWPYVPTGTQPAYVVAVKTSAPRQSHMEGGATERALSGAIPWSDVVHVYEGRPWMMRTGSVDLVPTYRTDSTHGEGSRSSPDGPVLWRAIAHKKSMKYSPDQPRDPAGSSTGGQWTSGGGAAVEAQDPEFISAQAAAFVTARESGASRPTFLSHYREGELTDKQLFLSRDGKTGYLLDSQGDLQNVFNNGGAPGAGTRAVVDAIEHGATTLDCFDGFLPKFYAKMGFVATGRMAFNDDYKPEGWDVATQGRPDVVFMSYQGGDRATIATRLNTFTPYSGTDGVTYTDWEAAKSDSRRAVRDVGAGRRTWRSLRTRALGLPGGAAALPRHPLKYSPDQPREPAGSPEGGRFTSGGGAETSTSATPYPHAAPTAYVRKPATIRDVAAPLLHAGLRLEGVNFLRSKDRTDRELAARPHTDWSTDDVLIAQGVATAVMDAREDSDIFAAIKNHTRENLPIVMIDCGPNAGMLWTAMNEGKPYIGVNLNPETVQRMAANLGDPTKDDATVVTAVVNQAARERGVEAGLRETYKGAMWHEMGHVGDILMARKDATQLLVSTLDRKFRTDHAIVNWIEKRISRYAASSAYETVAEVFTMMQYRQRMPPTLKPFVEAFS